jgi:hypothetical protein
MACAHFLWITLCVTVCKQSKPLISKNKFLALKNEAVYIRSSASAVQGDLQHLNAVIQLPQGQPQYLCRA